MKKVRKVPLRQCIACREQKPKRELLRIVRNQDGELLVDYKGKVPGRGAYICPGASCLARAQKEKLFMRHLGVTPSAALLAELEDLLGDHSN